MMTTREVQLVYRLDGLTAVTMGYPHNRVLEVLRDFDQLVNRQE